MLSKCFDDDDDNNKDDDNDNNDDDNDDDTLIFYSIDSKFVIHLTPGGVYVLP